MLLVTVMCEPVPPSSASDFGVVCASLFELWTVSRPPLVLLMVAVVESLPAVVIVIEAAPGSLFDAPWTLPSSLASVWPLSCADGLLSPTSMAPPVSVPPVAVATLLPLAAMVSAALGELINAEPPTTAWVIESEVTLAEPVAPPNEPRPIETRCESVIAWLGPLAVIVIALAPMIDPSTSAFAPDAMIATGLDEPKLTMPPVPALESELAVLVELAVTVTAPLEWTVPPMVAATSPSCTASPAVCSVDDEPISASEPAPAPANPIERPVTLVCASASFDPVAVTLTEVEPVIEPLTAALRPPSISATLPMLVLDAKPAPVRPLAVAFALSVLAIGAPPPFGIAVSASTITAPAEIDPPPISAVMPAVSVISASAKDPLGPEIAAIKETVVASTSEVARFQPRAWTFRSPPLYEAL